jgi:hypothetical protein
VAGLFDSNVVCILLLQAFRVVTTLPVVLLKTATKQIQEGFQAARQRLSVTSAGNKTSFSERWANASFNDSFSSDSGIGSLFLQSSPSVPPKPINEGSQELDPDSPQNSPRNLKHVLTEGDNSLLLALSPPPNRATNPLSRLFRARTASTAGSSMEETSSASSRIASFFRRGGRDSDVSMNSAGVATTDTRGSEGGADTRDSTPHRDGSLLFGRKRSDISNISAEDECDDDDETSMPRPVVPRTRVPNAVQHSLLALKRSAASTNENCSD